MHGMSYLWEICLGLVWKIFAAFFSALFPLRIIKFSRHTSVLPKKSSLRNKKLSKMPPR